MKIALTKILKKITPLPWKLKEFQCAITETHWMPIRYAAHASNLFPEVVGELNRLRDLVGEVDVEIIDEILSRAEEVNIPNR